MGELENLKIVFIGIPGSGKSSVINMLLGKKQCEVGQTFQTNGKTQQSQDCRCFIFTSSALEAETETNDAKLPERNNDDTPTTSKTHRKELKTNVELIDTTNIENDLQDLCAKKGGFNAFAFICPLTRYEETNIKFLKGIVSMFGQSFFSRCILILTQRSKEQIDETELQKEINKVSDMDDNMRKILGDENRYLLCPNFEFEKLSERYDSFQHSFANSLSEIAYRCFIDSSLKIKLNIEDDIEHNSAPDRKCDIL